MDDSISRRVDQAAADEIRRQNQLIAHLTNAPQDPTVTVQVNGTKGTGSDGNTFPIIKRGNPSDTEGAIRVNDNYILAEEPMIIQPSIGGDIGYLLVRKSTPLAGDGANYDWFIKDIGTEIFYKLSVADQYLICNVAYESGIAQIDTIRFTPNGKNLFVGSTQFDVSNDVVPTWGFAMDWQLNPADDTHPDPYVSWSSLLQGSYTSLNQGMATLAAAPTAPPIFNPLVQWWDIAPDSTLRYLTHTWEQETDSNMIAGYPANTSFTYGVSSWIVSEDGSGNPTVDYATTYESSKDVTTCMRLHTSVPTFSPAPTDNIDYAPYWFQCAYGAPVLLASGNWVRPVESVSLYDPAHSPSYNRYYCLWDATLLTRTRTNTVRGVLAVMNLQSPTPTPSAGTYASFTIDQNLNDVLNTNGQLPPFITDNFGHFSNTKVPTGYQIGAATAPATCPDLSTAYGTAPVPPDNWNNVLPPEYYAGLFYQRFTPDTYTSGQNIQWNTMQGFKSKAGVSQALGWDLVHIREKVLTADTFSSGTSGSCYADQYVWRQQEYETTPTTAEWLEPVNALHQVFYGQWGTTTCSGGSTNTAHQTNNLPTPNPADEDLVVSYADYTASSGPGVSKTSLPIIWTDQEYVALSDLPDSSHVRSAKALDSDEFLTLYQFPADSTFPFPVEIDDETNDHTLMPAAVVKSGRSVTGNGIDTSLYTLEDFTIR